MQYSSGKEWLDFRLNWIEGQRRIEALKELESLAAKIALKRGGHDPYLEMLPWTYGIQTIYKTTLRDSLTGLTHRVELHGFGTQLPTGDDERIAYFSNQIDVILASLRHNNAEKMYVSLRYFEGGLVEIAKMQARNALGIMHEGVSSVGGSLAAMNKIANSDCGI